YEALCYFSLFAVLMWMYWKKNAEERTGLIFGVFLTGIFLPRFLIEFIKNDQVDFEATMALNMGQWLSIPFVLIGIGLVIYAMRRPRIRIDFPDRFADEDEKPRKKNK
ncbi:prolipoprotein diacylglyceryl transferase family protein, partial [uncultured Duncaniella sp.]